MYYIISLTHTMRHEKYITLWRPNNAGYCYSKENAGVYESYIEGYHNSENNMPIIVKELDLFFKQTEYDRKIKEMIPNSKATWDLIGVKMTKDGLKRK